MEESNNAENGNRFCDQKANTSKPSILYTPGQPRGGGAATRNARGDGGSKLPKPVRVAAAAAAGAVARPRHTAAPVLVLDGVDHLSRVVDRRRRLGRRRPVRRGWTGRRRRILALLLLGSRRVRIGLLVRRGTASSSPLEEWPCQALAGERRAQTEVGQRGPRSGGKSHCRRKRGRDADQRAMKRGLATLLRKTEGRRISTTVDGAVPMKDASPVSSVDGGGGCDVRRGSGDQKSQHGCTGGMD